MRAVDEFTRGAVWQKGLGVNRQSGPHFVREHRKERDNAKTHHACSSLNCAQDAEGFALRPMLRAAEFLSFR
jgi:hypothetical protein